MFKQSITRPIPAGAEIRTTKNGQEAKILVDGRWVWLPINASGKYRDRSRVWYQKIRMADGTTKAMGFFTNKAASEAKAREIQLEQDRVRAGLAAPRPIVDGKVDDLLEKFESFKRIGGLSAATAATEFPRLRKAVEQLGWKTVERIRQANSSDIIAWFEKLPGAAATKKKRLHTLATFLRWLVEERVLVIVPRLPRPSAKPERPRRAITQEEVEKLAKSTTWPWSILYRLAFFTLTRKGALFSLLVGDLHLDGPEGPRIVLRPETAKTKVGQVVPVPSRLVPDLRRLVAEADGRPLFWRIQTINDRVRWAKDIKAAGIPHETDEGLAVFHSLRHGGATHLAKKGVSILLIQKMGGWKSIRMLEKYTHIQPIDAREAIDAAFSKNS
jgi:integrase